MEEFEFDEGDIEITPLTNEDSGVSYHGGGSNKSYRDFKKPFKPNEESVKVIYTDGGSKRYELPEGFKYVGSWSFYDENAKELRGEAVEDATNNQMELEAAIQALQYLDDMGVAKDKWVTIKLDSDYVRKGILFWVKKWVQNDWKRQLQDGTVEEVKNREYWEKLYTLNTSRKIYWILVPGHSGVEGNEIVDSKCSQLIRQYADEHDISKRANAK